MAEGVPAGVAFDGEGAGAPFVVDPIWAGATVFVLGGGSSLDDFPLDRLAARRAADLCRVIAVNDAMRAAPFADVVHYGDDRWRTWTPNATDLRAHAAPLKTTTAPAETNRPARLAAIRQLRYAGREGLSHERDALCGRDAGKQAINLAIHRGAARVVAVAFDMAPAEDGRTHHRWTARRPIATPSDAWAPWLDDYRSMWAELAVMAGMGLAVEILLCTPSTVLADVFPRVLARRVL